MVLVSGRSHQVTGFVPKEGAAESAEASEDELIERFVIVLLEMSRGELKFRVELGFEDVNSSSNSHPPWSNFGCAGMVDDLSTPKVF